MAPSPNRGSPLRVLCLAIAALAGLHTLSVSFSVRLPQQVSPPLLVPTAAAGARRSFAARAAYESGKVNVGASEASAPAVEPQPLLEVNEATSLAIMDCIEEGCSVDALTELDAKLARDEGRVEKSMQELRAQQKTAFTRDNEEALAWLGNFLGRSGSLRGQLQAMRGVQDTDFVKQIVKAAAVAFGGGRPNDYPKVGVSPYSA